MPATETIPGLETFLREYIRAALWASTDEEGEAYDAYASAADLAPETLARMREDCEAFLQENMVNAGYLSPDTYLGAREDWLAAAAHDFWLTRNRHGSGFWDSRWDDSVSRELTDSAHAYGECDLYTGDDGKLYLA